MKSVCFLYSESLGETFSRFLSFVIDSVFLRLLSRAYSKAEEKWDVAEPCLCLFNKILSRYNPSARDFQPENAFFQPLEDVTIINPQSTVRHPGMSLLSHFYNEGGFFATVS